MRPTTVYVITAPRPGGASYVSVVMSQVSAQWQGPKVLWSDGPVEVTIPLSGWQLRERPRVGPPNTLVLWDLLQDARARGGDAIVLEDDVDVAPGAIPYMARIGCPAHLAYISWFDPILRRAQETWPVGALIPAGRILPAQARTYPERTIARLCEAGPGRNLRAGCDARVAEVPNGQLAGVHAPSLVQHVGAVSAAMPGAALTPERKSDTFLRLPVGVDMAFCYITSEYLFGAPPA